MIEDVPPTVVAEEGLPPEPVAEPPVGRAVPTGTLPAEFRRLFNRTGAMCFELDGEGSAVYVSDGCAALTGYRPEELLGRDLFRLLCPGPLAAGAAALAERLRHGDVAGYELAAATRQGAALALEVSTANGYAAGGRLRAVVGVAADAAPGRRAEEAARQLAAIVEGSDDAIVGETLDGVIATWNAAAERVYGYAAAEVVGRSGFVLVPPERADELPPILRRLRRGERVDHVETVRVRKDGRRIHVSLTCSPIKDAAGRLTGTSTIARDVSDRKHAEERIHFQASLLDQVRNAVAVTDMDGKVTYWNRFAETLYQWRAAEVMGQRLWETIVPPEGQAAAEQLAASIKETGYGEGELIVRRKDGNRFPALFIDVPLRDAQGKMSGVIAVSLDVTERKRAEQTLREANQNLSALIRYSPLAIFALDRDGAVKVWNAAAEQMLGWPEPEVVGRPVPWGSPDKPEEFSELFREALAGHATAGRDTACRRRDGRRLDVRLALAPLYDAAGTLNGCIGFVADTTEQKRLEEQFRQAQKMEAVGRLASGVAHDFNNMLTVITGYSELLLSSLPDGDPSRDLIGEIRKSGDRATTLTRQLLAFSRQQKLTPVTLDLNSLIADMGKMLRRLLTENIALTTALSPDLGKVKADPGQIDQVVMNLVINARDAMPQGGAVTLETRNVTLGESEAPARSGSFVLLSVRDTGLGMDEQTRAHIFEPFFTTKEVGKGTGLGLATVYGIVQQSGGFIEVDSAPDRGSTFHIYLPRLGETPSSVDVEPPRPASVRGTETVLLVEDDDKVRSLACLILRSNGYTVIEARNGSEALSLTETYRGPVHVLVTDVVMPHMNGRQLADALRHRYAGLKVLYCSGHCDEAVFGNAALQQSDPFLQKPFTLAALVRKVREVLDGPRKDEG